MELPAILVGAININREQAHDGKNIGHKLRYDSHRSEEVLYSYSSGLHLSLGTELRNDTTTIHAPTEEKYVKTLRARVITNYNSYVVLSLVRCGCGCTRQGRCSWRVLAQKENNLTEIFCCFGMLYGVRSAHNTNLHTICNNIAQNIVVSF